MYEDDGFFYFCSKCNKYIHEYRCNIKKSATYADKILIIERNRQLPKMELYEKNLSIGKKTLKCINKWISSITQVNNHFMSYFVNYWFVRIK